MTHPPIGTTSDGEPVTPRIGNHITLRIIAWLNPGAGAKGMIAIRRTPVAPSIKFTVLLAIITPVFAIFTPALSNVASFPAHITARSEERRVGKECVSTGRSRWSPDH